MASKITRRAAAFSAACLLLGSIAPIAQAQPASPVQVWDIVVSGTQRGLAQITFSSDFTLSGVEIITGTIHDSSTDTNPRGPFFSGSRLPFPENTNSTPVTNFYGRAYLSGRWTYDSAGRTIGVMSESGGPDSLTNGISFKAVVRPDVRINIEGLRGGRHLHYRGVPRTSLADLSGGYYGIGRKAGHQFNELFQLTPDVAPNTYQVTAGLGAGYSFIGYAFVSSKNQMAFVSLSDETEDGILRSVAGPFSLTKGIGSLRGVIADGAGGEINTRLKVTKQ